MSFVALALVAQATSFGQSFLPVAALVLTVDLVVGLTTFIRVGGANVDDLRALHGMARIRHAYTQITPIVTPYFTRPIHDDIDAVTSEYGVIGESLPAQFLYGLTTSAGMIGLIVAMVGGVLATVLAMLTGLDTGVSTWIGIVAGVIVLVGLFAYAAVIIPREQARFTALFPTPSADPVTD
jgi:hypothetical protein